MRRQWRLWRGTKNNQHVVFSNEALLANSMFAIFLFPKVHMFLKRTNCGAVALSGARPLVFGFFCSHIHAVTLGMPVVAGYSKSAQGQLTGV